MKKYIFNSFSIAVLILAFSIGLNLVLELLNLKISSQWTIGTMVWALTLGQLYSMYLWIAIPTSVKVRSSFIFASLNTAVVAIVFGPQELLSLIWLNMTFIILFVGIILSLTIVYFFLWYGSKLWLKSFNNMKKTQE